MDLIQNNKVHESKKDRKPFQLKFTQEFLFFQRNISEEEMKNISDLINILFERIYNFKSYEDLKMKITVLLSSWISKNDNFWMVLFNKILHIFSRSKNIIKLVFGIIINNIQMVIAHLEHLLNETNMLETLKYLIGIKYVPNFDKFCGYKKFHKIDRNSQASSSGTFQGKFETFNFHLICEKKNKGNKLPENHALNCTFDPCFKCIDKDVDGHFMTCSKRHERFTGFMMKKNKN